MIKQEFSAFDFSAYMKRALLGGFDTYADYEKYGNMFFALRPKLKTALAMTEFVENIDYIRHAPTGNAKDG